MSGTGLETVLWCDGTGRFPLLFRDLPTRLKNPLPREPVESSEQFDFLTLMKKRNQCHSKYKDENDSHLSLRLSSSKIPS